HTLGKPECHMRAGLPKGLCRRSPSLQDGLHRHSIKRISASTNGPSILSVLRLPLLTICDSICISGRTLSSARLPPRNFANIWISPPRLFSDWPWEWISEGEVATQDEARSRSYHFLSGWRTVAASSTCFVGVTMGLKMNALFMSPMDFRQL